MRNTSLAVALSLMFLGACSASSDYDFRDQNRPTYDDTVTIDDITALRGNPKVKLLDVRLLEDYQANSVLIPGATYMNPENIETWSSELPMDSKVVVYCVKGKWVSQKAANYLSDRGIETYSLEGGIEAWQQTENH